MFIASQLNRQVDQTYERVFLSTLLWSLIILSPGLFGGSLASVFTIPILYPQLNTFKDILEAGLKLPFVDTNVGYGYYSADSISWEIREINKRVIKYKPKNNSTSNRLPMLLPYTNPDTCLALPLLQLGVSGLAEHYDPNFGKLHIASQTCLTGFYRTYPFKRFGAFNNRMKFGGMLFCEGGLIDFWYRQMVNKARVESVAKYYRLKPGGGDIRFQAFELDHFFIPLLILGFGWTAGFVCLGIELSNAKKGK